MAQPQQVSRRVHPYEWLKASYHYSIRDICVIRGQL